MTDQEKLQVLLDRVEISEVVYNYATGVDSKDEKLFRSIWADEITVDGVGGPFGPQSKPATLSADKWASIIIRRISKYAVTQHMLTNPKIEVNGDQAKCVVYMQARHFVPGWQPGQPIYDMGGYYTHDLVRTASQGWRIKSYCLHVLWHINPPEA
jgi:hypothetical protein